MRQMIRQYGWAMCSVGFLVMIALCAVVVLVQGPWTPRTAATYMAGDCLRTPPATPVSERWEEAPAPQDIVMITEVGNHQYRYREWGIQRRNPEWYPSYDAKPFAFFDGAAWQPTTCPEQGPDPAPEPEVFDQPQPLRRITIPTSDGNEITIESNSGFSYQTRKRLPDTTNNVTSFSGNTVVQEYRVN